MLSRSESQKSGFVPKTRPLSSNKFRYFGDDSEISQLANIHYKKSGNLLGTRFTDSTLKFSNISRIDNEQSRSNYKENQSNKYQLDKYTQRNQQHNFQAKSQISGIESAKNSSVSGLKSQIGELTGRLKNLEGLLSTLAENEVKTREEIKSLRKCVSEKSLGRPDSLKPRIVSPAYTHNYFNADNTDIADLLTESLNNKIKRDLRRKEKESCLCQCTGFKSNDREKQQMSGIIFELYEENRFYENQLSKIGELKKSSVQKNKARINELLGKMRNI